jgi:hypothetical protein
VETGVGTNASDTRNGAPFKQRRFDSRRRCRCCCLILQAALLNNHFAKIYDGKLLVRAVCKGLPIGGRAGAAYGP